MYISSTLSLCQSLTSPICVASVDFDSAAVSTSFVFDCWNPSAREAPPQHYRYVRPYFSAEGPGRRRRRYDGTIALPATCCQCIEKHPAQGREVALRTRVAERSPSLRGHRGTSVGMRPQCALVVVALAVTLSADATPIVRIGRPAGAATAPPTPPPTTARGRVRTCESVLQVLCVSTTRTAESCGVCAGKQQAVLREVGCGGNDVSRYCAVPRGSSVGGEPYRVANLIYEGPHTTGGLHTYAYDSAGGKTLFVADSGNGDSGDCRGQAIYQWDIETQTQLPTLDVDVALGINGTGARIGCIDYLEYDAKRQLLISGSKGSQPYDNHNENGTQWSSVNSSHVLLVWSTLLTTAPPKLLAKLQGHNTAGTHTSAIDPLTRVVTNEVLRAVTYDRSSGRLIASISEDIDHNTYADTPWGYGSGSCLPNPRGPQHNTCENMGSYSCGGGNAPPCDEFNLTGSMQLNMLDTLQTALPCLTQGHNLGRYNGSHVRLQGWVNNDTEHPGNLSDATPVRFLCGEMVAAWTPQNATVSFPDLLAFDTSISPAPPPGASCFAVAESGGRPTRLNTSYNALWMTYDAKLDVLNVSMQWPGQPNPSNRTRFTLWPASSGSRSHRKVIEQTEDSIMQWDLALDAKKTLPILLPKVQLELGCDPSLAAAVNSSCENATSPAGGWASGLAYDSVGHRLYTLGVQDFAPARGANENQDGSWPATACNRTIEQWDTTSAVLPPRHLHTMYGHTGCVQVLAFDAIHKRLYSGSNDSTSACASDIIPACLCLGLSHDPLPLLTLDLSLCLCLSASVSASARLCVCSHRVGHELGTPAPDCRARQLRRLARSRRKGRPVGLPEEQQLGHDAQHSGAETGRARAAAV